jgi:hypothetical protein
MGLRDQLWGQNFTYDPKLSWWRKSSGAMNLDDENRDGTSNVGSLKHLVRLIAPI